MCWLEDVVSIYAYSAVLFLLSTVSTIENLIVLMVIVKNEVLHTASLLLLGVLAVIDLIDGSIVIPIIVQSF